MAKEAYERLGEIAIPGAGSSPSPTLALTSAAFLTLCCLDGLDGAKSSIRNRFLIPRFPRFPRFRLANRESNSHLVSRRGSTRELHSHLGSRLNGKCLFRSPPSQGDVDRESTGRWSAIESSAFATKAQGGRSWPWIAKAAGGRTLEGRRRRGEEEARQGTLSQSRSLGQGVRNQVGDLGRV